MVSKDLHKLKRLNKRIRSEGLGQTDAMDRDVSVFAESTICPLPGFDLFTTGDIARDFGARDENPPRGDFVLSFVRVVGFMDLRRV